MYYLIGHLVLEIHLVVLLHYFNYTNYNITILIIPNKLILLLLLRAHAY